MRSKNRSHESQSLESGSQSPESEYQSTEPEYQPPESLTVNKITDHFFISINKKMGHSFIMLGVYDQNKFRHVLCRVGKVAEVEVDENGETDYPTNLQFLCNALFFASKAYLKDEGVSRKKRGNVPITYQAYDISYEQYIEFVRILESLRGHDTYTCYKPDSDSAKDEVTLTLTSEKKLSSVNVNKLNTDLLELNVGNTCRHAAIELIEAIQHVPISPSVSSSFLTNLPYETVLEYGSPSENLPFYVLPPPPASFQSDKAKEKVITKLYSRMENMLLLEPDSQYTQDKFLKLKELYLNIVGSPKDLSLDRLLTNILTWKDDKNNQKILNVLRKEYFWDSLPFIKRQSATMNLLAEVEEDLTTEIKNRKLS
ncbi:hypothetical protein [Legionella parisiensis]|uniref:Uncharacterized protein n=1 Tax=Legionella parisiensis TaxID=45071 RepID=A0A1E5JPM5_9GAMM|nr:hypothetical protein [Legionella parisiensis]KTD40984.1 hypothetical protein Lpar_2301 [Legionella parisiensis]OEH46497.1 hypothetical protein lpari_02513 [Legionella parisiensis]STX76724.1 Uncharacterised protein [Legionella parisiensis]